MAVRRAWQARLVVRVLHGLFLAELAARSRVRDTSRVRLLEMRGAAKGASVTCTAHHCGDLEQVGGGAKARLFVKCPATRGHNYALLLCSEVQERHHVHDYTLAE
jgi:hypothetical protein